jgi:hypothetical protein
MKNMKSLLGCIVLFGVILFPISARADLDRICTRQPNSRVTLRQGPGVDYERGLVEVGSGGEAVYRSFEAVNFTVLDREEISVFSMTHGTDGRIWYKVGTNQWVAWVRSDFVCRNP